MEFKLIVAGGRDFSDYLLLQKELDKFLYDYRKLEIVIVSGGAVGADKLGERYAKERGYKLITKQANWFKYKKAAGMKRNAEMAEISDACILFWDGISKGTQNMMQLANNNKLDTKVVYYSNRKG